MSKSKFPESTYADGKTSDDVKPDTKPEVAIPVPVDPFPKASAFGDKDSARNVLKENASPSFGNGDFKSDTSATTIDGKQIDPTLLGSPATGGPVTAPTGMPPQAAVGTSADILDASKTDKTAILDRMAADHAALTTPEVHKTALRKADEAREHGAPAINGSADQLLQQDTGPRDIVRDDINPGYEAYREVTVKLGAPQEADYVSEGMVVSHVNTTSGEVSFRVEAGSPAYTSVRARQVVKR